VAAMVKLQQFVISESEKVYCWSRAAILASVCTIKRKWYIYYRQHIYVPRHAI